MVDTLQLASYSIYGSMIALVFTIGYSIYMAYLNQKQAKTLDVLLRIEKLLQGRNKIK